MKEIDIYTDGACSGNPGMGGWAAVLFYKSSKKEISGFERETTNNRMELMAVISGLSSLNQPCKVRLFSDSSYVINAFVNGWLDSWQVRGWRTADNKEVKNIDLWQQLTALCKKHQVEWVKVKGHSDNVYNNRCDELARAEIARQQTGTK